MYENSTQSTRQRSLNESGMYDSLTHLYSKPLFIQVVDSLLRISKRQQMPVSLAMISINRFHELEDKYGASECESVVKNGADIIKSISRDSDVLSHFNVDTFALLLYNCNYDSTQIVMDRIYSNVNGHLSIQQHPVTISVGRAEFDAQKVSSPDCLSEHLINTALTSLEVASQNS
ncbi:GGDEF domain-containing protein [Vibrio sp.]|nr:GGDEF domain-containing protein [Vibrio sp.]